MIEEPNLECPDCHTKFFAEFNVYGEYIISCPNQNCKASEEGCDNNLQFFIVIQKEKK